METTPQPSTLGRAALWLGISSSSLVFGIGLCAVVSAATGLIQLTGLPAYVCGGSSAFLGLVGAIIAVGALFEKNTARAVVVVGLVLSLLSLCMFVGFLSIV